VASWSLLATLKNCLLAVRRSTLRWPSLAPARPPSIRASSSPGQWSGW
jgi:hypothetical protein